KRQHHCPRPILIVGGPNQEGSIFSLFYILYLLACSHIEIRAIQHHVPERQQVFFRELGFLELAVHGKFHGAGHDQLLPRILRDGSSNLVLLQRNVVEFVFDGPQRGGNSGRTSSHNENVINIRCRGSQARDSFTYGVDAGAPLVHRILDQGQAAEFADDEEIRDGSLVFRRQKRHVGAHARGGHKHGDGANGTRFSAPAVTYALISVDYGHFARNYGEYIAVRTDGRTSRATNAVGVIDMGMLGLRSFGIQ